MDPYEQYLADAEYEDYLRQAQAEKISPARQSSQLGADYDQSVASNLVKGAVDSPRAAVTMAKDAYNTFSPYSTEDGWQVPVASAMQRAGAENTLRTVGGLGAGVAGAAALAPIGAAWGTALGPLGTLAGGTLFGAAGGAAGLMGFDFATDATSGEIKPTDQYIKDLAYNTSQGTVIGGATSAAARIPAVKNRIVEPFTKSGQEVKVAQYLDQLEPGYADKIDPALQAQAGDPFLDQRPLGELIGSDTLKNAQRTIARSGPESYGRSAEANSLRNDTHLKYLDQIEKSPLDVASVQDSIQQSIAQRQAASQRGITAAEDLVNSSLADLPPPIDVVEAGGQMREGAATGLDAQRGRVTAGFEGIGNGTVDPTPAKMVAARDLPNYFKEVGAQPNPKLVELVDSLSREAETSGLLGADGKPITREFPYTIKDIQALRSQALDIANSSDARSARVAGNIADALAASVDDAITKGTVTPEQALSWQKGIEERKTQGVIYESSATPTKQVLSKQPYGEFKVPESAVPSKYFRPGEKGTREAVRNYKQAIGNSEQALEPLYRYATDSFKDYVVKDGKVDAKKARKWLERHANALEEIPDLKRQLSNVDEAQRFLNEKYGDLQRSQAEVEKGALKQFLQVDPEKAIASMLSGKDMVKRTLSTVQYLKANDVDALAGLRRGVIEHLKQKSFIPDGKISLEEASMADGPRFDGTVRGGLLKGEWEKIKPALERSKLFTDSQMKGFDYLYKDKSSQLSVEKARMPGGSDTAQNTSTLAALGRAAGSGFLKNLPYGRYIAFLEPVLKAIPQAKFQAALEEALLNPRYARDLMAKANAKNFTRSAQTIFKEEFAKAFGDTSAMQAAQSAAPIAASLAPVVGSQETPKRQKPPAIPNQSQVTSKKSFPTTQQLLSPTTPGSLKKTSFDLKSYIASQAPETRATISVESSGNPFAVSPKGAQGLSQLMPATAQDIAKDLGEVYMPLTASMTPEQQQASIEQNVRFGEHYKNVMLPKINPAFKNPTLARAAYNAGPQRVTEAMALAGSQTDVNKILASLPKGVQKETVPYVTEIMKRLG